jgi:hypothetical protein
LLNFAAAALFAAATLQPVETSVLDRSCGDRVSAVAWASDDELLLASVSGVTRYSIERHACSPFISPQEPPNGISHVFNVASDGRSVVAFALPVSQYAARLPDGARLFARRRPDFLVSDLAVRGGNLFVLGFRGYEKPKLPETAVWRGPVSSDWSGLTPLHRLTTQDALMIFRHSVPGMLGSIAVGGDGTLYVITSSEAGVFRYRADGTPLPPLGGDLTDLVIKQMPELYFNYRTDEIGRYRQVLNRQPIADDLVVTPDGPAILVRRATGNTLQWELWYPAARGVTATMALAPSGKGPTGHMRCDARGSRLACVLRRPLDRDSSEQLASLYLFQLPKVAKR